MELYHSNIAEPMHITLNIWDNSDTSKT